MNFECFKKFKTVEEYEKAFFSKRFFDVSSPQLLVWNPNNPESVQFNVFLEKCIENENFKDFGFGLFKFEDSILNMCRSETEQTGIFVGKLREVDLPATVKTFNTASKKDDYYSLLDCHTTLREAFTYPVNFEARNVDAIKNAGFKFGSFEGEDERKRYILSAFDFLAKKDGLKLNYLESDTWKFKKEGDIYGAPLEEINNPIRNVSTAIGVVTPQTLIGLTMSFFCSHIEDLDGVNAYNVLYAGGYKCWIIVRDDDMDKLEVALLEYLKTRQDAGAEFQPCIVKHKRVFIHPFLLIEWGIEFAVVVQSPGMGIVTKKRAFHQGFNQSWNICKAGNVILADYKEWILENGNVREETQCYCRNPGSATHTSLTPLERRVLRKMVSKEIYLTVVHPSVNEQILQSSLQVYDKIELKKEDDKSYKPVENLLAQDGGISVAHAKLRKKLNLEVLTELEAANCHLIYKNTLNQTSSSSAAESPYRCSNSVCSHSTFANSSSASVHANTHNGTTDKVFECKECKKTFTQKTSLQRHLRSKQEKGKLYKGCIWNEQEPPSKVLKITELPTESEN